MKYKCINELDKFSFREAIMEKCECREDVMIWELTGVIAKYDNPANETLVDRYIDTTQVRLKKPVIKKLLLEGAKYYDANEVLLREVPDQDIPEEDYDKTFRLFVGAEIFVILQKEASREGMLCCQVAVDIEEDTYWFEVEYEKAVFEWNNFLNKVEQEEQKPYNLS